MNTRIRNTVLLTMLIDMIGVGIIIPVLPYYVESFGVAAVVVTSLAAVYSLCAIVSMPLLGVLSDRIGRRPVLIMSIASTALGWFVFAASGQVWMLFLGRIIDGLASGNYSTAQSYLIDLAGEAKERTQALGLASAVFGVGVIVGPMIGGLLGSWSATAPFWFVAALATVNLAMAVAFLPETLPPEKRSRRPFSFNPLRPVIDAFRNGHIRRRLVTWSLFCLVIATQQTAFALFAGRVFGFGAFETGIVMMVMGVVIVLNQMVLMRHVWLKRFAERDLERWMTLALVVGFSLIATASLPLAMLGLFIHTLSQSTLRAVSASLIAGQVPDRRGEIMGVINTIMNLAMVVAAPLAGYLLDVGASWPYLVGASLAAISYLLLRRRHEAADSPSA